MKCVHVHSLSSYHVMDYGGLFCMITCVYLFNVYLFIAILLCRTFVLGEKAVKIAFFSSFFVATVFFFSMKLISWS